jgi:hypothetical protein
MTTELNLHIPAGFTAASRREAKTALPDVGRDRYFLNALQGNESATGATASPVTSLPEHPAITAAHEFAAPVPRGTLPVDSARMATPPPAQDGNAARGSGASAALAMAAIVTGNGNAAPTTATLRLAPEIAGNDTCHRTARPQHGGSGEKRIWLPQNITLRESADGVDVIARNFFLDNAGRRQLALRILQDLAAAGKSPRQLTLNGELLWRAEASANPYNHGGGIQHAR